MYTHCGILQKCCCSPKLKCLPSILLHNGNESLKCIETIILFCSTEDPIQYLLLTITPLSFLSNMRNLCRMHYFVLFFFNAERKQNNKESPYFFLARDTGVTPVTLKKKKKVQQTTDQYSTRLKKSFKDCFQQHIKYYYISTSPCASSSVWYFASIKLHHIISGSSQTQAVAVYVASKEVLYFDCGQRAWKMQREKNV